MATKPVPQGFVVTSPIGPRWGTYHWGTDYGVVGGSGGKPIYAVKDGTVLQAGAASGFGQWIRLDHHANVGGGESVYGHIIPEVRAGQFVREGQRIGYINPDQRTNGGVAPHLHFEFYKTSWLPAAHRRAGTNVLDPERVLSGAVWPNTSKASHNQNSKTIFGIDVSEHQNGLSLKRAKDEGMQFVIIRLCDGTYKDKVFQSHLKDAEQNGLLISLYWYLRAPSEGTTIKQQVDVIDQQLQGQKKYGIWIDVESVVGNTFTLTGDDVKEAKRELESRGYYVPGVYSGAWYWEKMPKGEPSMQHFGYLWCSNYGRNLQGDPKTLYFNDGGDNHKGWSYPLGDRKPDLLQFGSRGKVAGFNEVDVNAYKGTLQQLQSIFLKGQQKVTAPNNDQINHLHATLQEVLKNQVIILRQLGLPKAWEQGGNRTLYDVAAATANKVGVPNTYDTLDDSTRPKE